MCRKADPDTPCITKTPKNLEFYTLQDDKYYCKYRFPDLTPYEMSIIEIYNTYGKEFMHLAGLDNLDDIVLLSRMIDNELSKNK